MTRQNYTKRKLELAMNRSRNLSGFYDIYSDDEKDEDLFLLDGQGGFLAEDHCRESLCQRMNEIISDNYTYERKDNFGYIGLILQDDMCESVLGVSTLGEALEKPGIQSKIDKLDAKILSRAHNVSRRVTSLEKSLGMRPHTVKFFTIDSGSEPTNTTHGDEDTHPKYVNGRFQGYENCIYVTHKAQYLMALRIDPKWFNSPPVLSFFMLAMRAAQRRGYRKTDYEKKLIYKLLKKRSPHEIFGKSRRTNWGMTKEEEMGSRFYHSPSGRKVTTFENFQCNYGERLFTNEVKNKQTVKLRERFPNNRIFDK